MRRPLFFLILLTVSAPVAGAQRLRGLVRDSTANGPLSGVVVTALDSAGGIAGRAISDEDGRFSFAPSANARRLHLIRIGYRPRDVDIRGRADVAITVVMERLPPILDVVRVSGSELCPGSADRGAAFQLWEQARAGLLATIVARDLKPAMATTVVYESAMSPSDERIHRQRREVKSGQTTRPFIASASPGFFVDRGYMVEDASGRQFNAPDADVLLHESFAATHCFHLQAADAAHPGQIGLAFAPIRGRDELVDVRGVLWIDRAVPQLESLDFAYTSLEPAAEHAGAGGHLEFHSMPNGVSFIERWNLRLPVLQVATSSSNPLRRDGRPPKRQDRFDLRVAEIVEAGGIVLEARWTDGHLYRNPPTGLSGIAVRRGTNAPVAGAAITLAGTADTIYSDATGAFEMQAIPGKYTIVATDTTLNAFTAPRAERRAVDVPRGGMTRVRMEMPALSDVLNDVCHGQRMADSSVIIIGYVARADAVPLRDGRVHAAWQDEFTKNAITGIMVQQREQDVDLDDDGRFVVCGVPRERLVKLELRQGDNRLADTTVRVMTPGLTLPVGWRLKSTPVIRPRQPDPYMVTELGWQTRGLRLATLNWRLVTRFQEHQ